MEEGLLDRNMGLSGASHSEMSSPALGWENRSVWGEEAGRWECLFLGAKMTQLSFTFTLRYVFKSAFPYCFLQGLGSVYNAVRGQHTEYIVGLMFIKVYDELNHVLIKKEM